MILLDWIYRLANVPTQLARIEQALTDMNGLIKEHIMASQAALDALAEAVRRNSDVVASAAAALRGYVATVADLTSQLQSALASSDQEAVEKAVADLAANNQALQDAVPAVAAAVASGTPAAGVTSVSAGTPDAGETPASDASAPPSAE